MGLKHRLYTLRRRVFGSWSIDDPRPIQADAPYTYFLPQPSGSLPCDPAIW